MGSKLRTLSALMLVLGMNGCGGGANNDAGMAFTLNGFNAVQNNACSPTPVSAVVMPISGGGIAEQSGAVGAFSCLNIQNNLVTQTVRVDRAMIRYFVAGASSQPPSTVTAAGVVLGAASGATSLPNGNGSQPGTKPGGTLPSGGTGGTGTGTGSSSGAPRATVSFAVVPAAVGEWISSHRSELPEPPFEMIASVTVSGITSAGNRIDTNELPLSVVVTEDNVF
jgi:hypothetical protein